MEKQSSYQRFEKTLRIPMPTSGPSVASPHRTLKGDSAILNLNQDLAMMTPVKK